MTSATALRVSVRSDLARAGVASPDADASAILAHVLGIAPAEIPLAPALSAEQVEQVTELARRRAEREPLQHLLGVAYFRHLTLAVGPGVFIPRPETETLVDAALARLSAGQTVVDLCSGSGAIALALATEGPELSVVAVELYEEALVWLRRNVAAHVAAVQAAGAQLTVLAADATTVALPSLAESVDLITCNPPYIPLAAVPRDPEVARYDPPTALYGGPDGLAVVRPIAEVAHRMLRPGGWLLVEHADQQGEQVAAGVPRLLREHGGYREVADLPDLTGRPRVTIARRR